MLTFSHDGFEVSVLHPSTGVDRWNLVYTFLQLRRQVFIQRMKWQLMDDKGIEFEQYDIMGVGHYVIAHRGDRVLGGARLVRCNNRIGQYSYMIRDAYLGKISLPHEICETAPPEDEESWELTRLVSDSADPMICRTVLNTANDFIFSQGGARCLFLGPPGFLRMARSYGYVPERLGQITGDESGRFLAFQCAILDRANMTTEKDILLDA